MVDFTALPADVLVLVLFFCGLPKPKGAVKGLLGVNGLAPGDNVLALEKLIRFRSVNMALRAFLSDPQTTVVLLGSNNTFFLPKVKTDGVPPMPETLLDLFWRMPKHDAGGALVLFHRDTPDDACAAIQEQILGHVPFEERARPVFYRPYRAPAPTSQISWRSVDKGVPSSSSRQRDLGPVKGGDGRGLKRASEEESGSKRQKVEVLEPDGNHALVDQIKAKGTRALVLGQQSSYDGTSVARALNHYLSTTEANSNLAVVVAPPFSYSDVASAAGTIEPGEYPRVDALALFGHKMTPQYRSDLDPRNVSAVVRNSETLSFLGLENITLNNPNRRTARMTNYMRMLTSMRGLEHIVFRNVAPPQGATTLDPFFVVRTLKKLSVTSWGASMGAITARRILDFVSRFLYLFDLAISPWRTIGETAAVALIASHFRYGDTGGSILSDAEVTRAAREHAGDPRLARVLQMGQALERLELSVCFNVAGDEQAKHALSAVLDLLKLIGPLPKLEELSLDLVPALPSLVQDDSADEANILRTVVSALGKQNLLPSPLNAEAEVAQEQGLQRLCVKGNCVISEENAVTLEELALRPSVKELVLEVCPPERASFLPALEGKRSAVVISSVRRCVAGSKHRLQEAMSSVEDELLAMRMPPSSDWTVLFRIVPPLHRFFLGELVITSDASGDRISSIVLNLP